MRLKYGAIIVLVSVVIVFVRSLDLGPYRDHHRGPSSSASLEFLDEFEVIVSPQKESWLIEKIDAAEKKVWISVYSFTLPSLREALLRAKNRGVEVKVIVEKFPFGNTSINRETALFFKTHDISFFLANQFAFMHAKYALFDDTWLVSTSNWTRASFSSNREFSIVGKDISVSDILSETFSGDFLGKTGRHENSFLLIGPMNARDVLEKYVADAPGDIRIYAPQITDPSFISSLQGLCRSRVVRILLGTFDDAENQIYGDCLQVRYMKKPLHAKVLLRGDGTAFVGSFNYTKNSLENNREIGIFLTGKNVKTISETFESDWKQSTVAVQ